MTTSEQAQASEWYCDCGLAHYTPVRECPCCGERRPMTTSEQKRADAMADAETLRSYLWQHYTRRYRPFLLASSSLALGLSQGETQDGLRNLARSIGEEAFRAVPALRGKD